MAKAYVMLADGFELIEAMAPVDVLDRAKIQVSTVSITGKKRVQSSHVVAVEAQHLIEDVDFSDADLVVLPGGYPGYVNLCQSPLVGKVAREQYESGRLLGAICGAPMVLQTYGIARGSQISCHHSVASRLTDYELTGREVTVDRNLITGAGAGVSVKFSLYMAGLLLDDEEDLMHLMHGLELR